MAFLACAKGHLNSNEVFMKKFLIGAFVFAMAVLPIAERRSLTAQDKEKSEQAKLFAEYSNEVKMLMSDWSTKARAASGKMRTATPEERAEINKEMMAAQKTLMATLTGVGEKMLTLASGDDKDTAIDAISWIMTQSQDAAQKSKAAEKLLADHLDNPKVAEMLSVFGRGGIPSEATQNLLKTFSEKSKSDSVKGISTMTLASYLRNGKSMLGSLIENPRFAEAYPGSMDYFKKLAATKDEDVENLLKTAAEKYADVEHAGSTIGKMAKRELKIIETQRNLQVGKIAPDIEGPDIDGVTFKLSDYRGKVVMLDFWGDW